MRGTLHFLAAHDLRWMLSLTSQRTLSGARTRFRDLGLDDETFDRAAEVASLELAGGGSASREEFFSLLRAAGISTEGQRGYHIIFTLSQRALVCWGPPRSNQQALVLVDEWIPETEVVDRNDALREFALRYFAGHGPATTRDFAWWTKLTLKDARAAVDLARDRLSALTLNDEEYWSVGDAEFVDTHSGVHALPSFDEYLLGYKDRSLVLAPEHIERVIPGKNGLFRPVVVADGSVVGTWRRGDVADGTSLIDEPFAPLTQHQAAALTAAEAGYRRFMQG